MKKIIIAAFVVLIWTLLINQTSYANPAFARKYQTSCVTCHTVYPQLNSFGESFRINGYQFPVDDEENVKEKPVPMGAEAYKRVWPDAVWPNSIPGTAPFSLRGRSAFTVSTDDSSGQTTSQFGMPALQILAAGVLGKDLSFWIGAHLFENGETGSIDNFFMKFDNLLTDWLPEKALYLKVGQFIPEIVPFATFHRSLTEAAYAMNTYSPSMGDKFVAGHAHGTGTFGIEQFQLGAEVSGVLHSRLRYVIGVVNGNSVAADRNSSRDFYGRLAYKFGGLAFDGTSTNDTTSAEKFDNSKETSFSLGAFGYKGIGTLSANEDYDFYRAGSDISFIMGSLRVTGGILLGSDGAADAQKYNLFFGEAQYMFYPWLAGIVRYEQANLKTLPSGKQIVVHISSLLVANVKIKAETVINPNKTDMFNLFIGLDFAL
ncbi:MAG: hypothetical protein HW421_1543 [Ignavibacteria bacterium]|nr:hypothetical protein [Ignavibacteria bacterium]